MSNKKLKVTFNLDEVKILVLATKTKYCMIGTTKI